MLRVQENGIDSMCRQHVELQIVFKDCMKFRKRVLDASLEKRDELEVYTSVGSATEQALCLKPEDHKYHKLKCLKRECKDCGVHKMVLLPEEKEGLAIMKSNGRGTTMCQLAN